MPWLEREQYSGSPPKMPYPMAIGYSNFSASALFTPSDDGDVPWYTSAGHTIWTMGAMSRLSGTSQRRGQVVSKSWQSKCFRSRLFQVFAHRANPCSPWKRRHFWEALQLSWWLCHFEQKCMGSTHTPKKGSTWCLGNFMVWNKEWQIIINKYCKLLQKRDWLSSISSSGRWMHVCWTAVHRCLLSLKARWRFLKWAPMLEGWMMKHWREIIVWRLISWEILNLLNIMLILFIDVHLISLPTNIGWTNLTQCSWTWKAAFLDLLRACSLVARDENIDRFASVEMASYCCAWIPGTDVF